VDHGQIVEHWDSGVRANSLPGQPQALIPGYGPRPVEPALTPAERATQSVADAVLKDIFQYGHTELAAKWIAPDYVEHGANGTRGRDGLVSYLRTHVPHAPLAAAWKDPPELVLTNADSVLYMMKRFSRDPADPSKIYKWFWFEEFRVSNGQVHEHWNLGAPAGSPLSPPPTVPEPVGFREYQ
jgi:predicted SnoaL-like aldol condensation-catalyzing enzyme